MGERFYGRETDYKRERGDGREKREGDRGTG